MKAGGVNPDPKDSVMLFSIYNYYAFLSVLKYLKLIFLQS